MEKGRASLDREPVEVASPEQHEDIARLAYALFLQRGGGHGHDLDDWLAAEQEVKAGAASTQRSAQKLAVARPQLVRRPARNKSV